MRPHVCARVRLCACVLSRFAGGGYATGHFCTAHAMWRSVQSARALDRLRRLSSLKVLTGKVSRSVPQQQQQHGFIQPMLYHAASTVAALQRSTHHAH